MLKRIFFITLYFASSLAAFSQVNTKGLALRNSINWPAFMAKQDMLWTKMPQDWDEGPFLGNGIMGAAIFKEPRQNYLRFEVGNSNVHDSRGPKPPRLLVGHFALRPLGEIQGCDLRLDLYNAEAKGSIKTSQGTIEIKAITHADRMVMLVEATPTGQEKITWDWIPAVGDNPRQLYGRGSGDYQPNPKPVIEWESNPRTSVQPLHHGGQYATAWTEKNQGKTVQLLVNITHTPTRETAKTEATQVVKEAAKQDWETLFQSHRIWWNNYYPQSFVSLPDKRMENFYWAQMYKLASATRADRALIDNTGPWLSITPWPNAWWNLNVQLTYWPTYTSNRLDLSKSLSNHVFNNIPNLIKNIPPAYQHNSAGIGRSSAFDLLSPVGEPGKGGEVGLLTWTCHNLWLQYRHTMDDEMLRNQIFPLLKRSVNYYLHFLKPEADGKLHLPSTFSPEYGVAEDNNFDLALLRWGAQTLLEITNRLKIQDPSIPEWKKVMGNLTDYPIDENGFRIGRNQGYDKSHRHYSHILMAYPLYTVNVEQPGSQDKIERTLAHWQSKKDALEGYSYTGGSSISAAIGKGNDALTYLNGLFTQFLRPNTMYKESGPVIETPLSGAQSIHDMLLQSWGSKIRVFPAVPDAWEDLSFHDFRTEGAFLVSAKREKGQTKFVRIKSLAGEPCLLKTDLAEPQVLKGGNSKIQPLGSGLYSIKLKKNEEVVLYSKGTPPDFSIAEVKPTNNGNNHFGQH